MFLSTLCIDSALLQSGALENTAQQNCPGSVTCENSQCTCPVDNTGAPGRLINMESQGIQCAYPHGACSFSEVRVAGCELATIHKLISWDRTGNCSTPPVRSTAPKQITALPLLNTEIEFWYSMLPLWVIFDVCSYPGFLLYSSLLLN